MIFTDFGSSFCYDGDAGSRGDDGIDDDGINGDGDDDCGCMDYSSAGVIMATQDRREQDRARRRNEILMSARAVFAQDGFHRATVDQIAQRAEVAKGTIYLYFETKEAILADLVLLALAELQRQLRDAVEAHSILQPEGRLRAMADAYLAFSQRSPDYFRLLTAFDGGDLGDNLSPQRNQLILAASNRTLDLVAQAVADGAALGVFGVRDARQAAAVLWAGLNGSLALLAHPIRRTMIQTDLPGLYHATLELLLKGLTCADDVDEEAAPGTGVADSDATGASNESDKEKMA